jgi:hypothetical protein
VTRTRSRLGLLLLAIIIFGGAYVGVEYTSQEVANPRRIDRALGEDDSRQVIVQAWWSPGSTQANMQWRIGALSQGSKLQSGATPRLPFERRGRIKRGESIILGWSMTPGPFAYIRWRVWLSGQVVKSGESRNPTLAITETPWA